MRHVFQRTHRPNDTWSCQLGESIADSLDSHQRLWVQRLGARKCRIKFSTHVSIKNCETTETVLRNELENSSPRGPHPPLSCLSQRIHSPLPRGEPWPPSDGNPTPGELLFPRLGTALTWKEKAEMEISNPVLSSYCD